MSKVSGWEPKRLTELANYVNGFAFRPEHWGQEGLPIIRIEQLKNPQAQADYFSGKLPLSKIIEDGDLVFSWSASLFLRIWQHGRAALNQHLFKVIEFDSIDRGFLKTFIEFHLPALTAASHGSTMQHITRKELARFAAPFPDSKDEQGKIARILSTVDRAIEHTEALIAKQERIKTGLMQDLLTRGIDEHGNLRSESKHQFKDSPVGRIPIDWNVVSLGGLLSGIDAGWSPNCEDEPPSQGEWGVLKVSAISSGVFDPIESKRLAAGLLPVPSLEVFQNDVLVSRANGVAELVGRCVLVEQTPGKLMLSDKTLRLVPRTGAITPFILTASMSSHLTRLQMGTLLSGSSGQKNITQKQLRTLLIAVAKWDEQIYAEKVMGQAICHIASDVEHLEKLRALKAGLMQDLLTGKKRVTIPLELNAKH